MVLVLPESRKRFIVNAFLDAAIAYELQSDWHSVFQVYSKKAMGKVHKQLKQWSIETYEHLDNAIKLFLEER